jgi:hypothetical protein
MNKKMAMMYGLAAMMAYDPMTNKVYSEKVDRPPIIPKPPNGSKEYFFNSSGEFSTTRMLKTECVFKCFAVNDKNALRKFTKWKLTKV